ncbi:MAG: class I SAM-dependent methyltransferase [Zavarzinella sp.]
MALSDSVGQFFDQLATDYNIAILRCFPKYPEMLRTVVDFLPDFHASTVAELGCGTGNLSKLLAAKYPESKMTLVDLSQDSLTVAQHSLPEMRKCEFLCCDMNDLDFPDHSFQVVTSAIAIHHLNSEQKKQLFAKIIRWLAPGGVFIFADQFRGDNDRLYQLQMNQWYQASMHAGSCRAEWDSWMSHQKEHDHHDRLRDQINWLEQAGFSTIDCVWKCMLWTVLVAEKSK